MLTKRNGLLFSNSLKCFPYFATSLRNSFFALTLFRLGFLRAAQLGGGGGGGGKVPAAYNSKAFNEMKFGGVVKDHITITKSKFE